MLRLAEATRRWAVCPKGRAALFRTLRLAPEAEGARPSYFAINREVPALERDQTAPLLRISLISPALIPRLCRGSEATIRAEAMVGAFCLRNAQAIAHMDKQITAPNCPTCGNRMFLFQAIPQVGSLPELRTYKCEECGVRKTEAMEARDDYRSRPKPNLYLVGPASSLLH